jgi:hypothetical protein
MSKKEPFHGAFTDFHGWVLAPRDWRSAEIRPEIADLRPWI